MSTSAADSNKIHKQWRNDSGELNVFEAARYFSSAVDHGYINHAGRRSLDMPIMIRSNPFPPEFNHHRHYIMDQKQHNKKMKQPSSPGVRLASFLNSLINQVSLKKKKSKSKNLEEESPNGRRKRRSSMGNFGIRTTSKTASDKGSGFRTPTKCYKDLDGFKDRDVVVLECEKEGVNSEKIGSMDVGKVRSYSSEKKGIGFRKWSEEDDDDNDGETVESDSSSDLFDLPNHDLYFFPSGLSVYETTHIQRITIPTAT